MKVHACSARMSYMREAADYAREFLAAKTDEGREAALEKAEWALREATLRPAR